MKIWNKLFSKTVIMVLLISIFTCLTVHAKYVQNDTWDSKITITAHLGNIRVDEHIVQKNPDGSYTLTGAWISGNTYKPNTYILIPGLDVPKDPVVIISNKSHLDAYVFLKVVTNISNDNNVDYALTNDWEEITTSTVAGVTTTVYVYTASTGNPVTIDDSFGGDGSGEIPVLVGNLFEVKEGLTLTSDVYLNFTAHMGQAIDGLDPLQVYQELFST